MFHHRHGKGTFGFRPPWARGFHRHPWGDGPGGGPPFGRGFGPGRGGRRFGRGDLKYVILDLLKDQPRHGYDVIRALEDRFHGFYSPSPGSVYPTLQLLEDQGYVTSTERDGKRVYVITDEGRRLLEEQSDQVEALRERVAAGWETYGNQDVRQLAQEVAQIGQLLFRQSGALRDPEKVRRLRDVVARAHREIESIVTDTATPSETMV